MISVLTISHSLNFPLFPPLAMSPPPTSHYKIKLIEISLLIYSPTVAIVRRGTNSLCSRELKSAQGNPSALPHSTADSSPRRGMPASASAKLATLTQAAKLAPSA